MKANLKIEAIGFKYGLENRLWRDAINKEMPGYGDNVHVSKKYWVAEICGKDDRFKYKRKFLYGKIDHSRSNSKWTRGVYVNYLLETCKIYEVSHPRTRKKVIRYFVTVDDFGNVIKHESYKDAQKAIRQECL